MKYSLKIRAFLSKKEILATKTLKHETPQQIILLSGGNEIQRNYYYLCKEKNKT